LLSWAIFFVILPIRSAPDPVPDPARIPGSGFSPEKIQEFFKRKIKRKLIREDFPRGLPLIVIKGT